jgi:hypothetical protein
MVGKHGDDTHIPQQATVPQRSDACFPFGRCGVRGPQPRFPAAALFVIANVRVRFELLPPMHQSIEISMPRHVFFGLDAT